MEQGSKKLMEYKIDCPECGSEMKLRNSKYGLFYGCSTYPNCKATHGAHPDGKPLGVPGDKETKKLRSKIHRLCENIWGEWKSKKCDRKGMYAWLKKNAPKPHIGEMDKQELLETKRLLKIKINEKSGLIGEK